MQDIDLIIKDREGTIHKVQAPTDMALNLMEVIQVPMAAHIQVLYWMKMGTVIALKQPILCPIREKHVEII